MPIPLSNNYTSHREVSCDSHYRAILLFDHQSPFRLLLARGSDGQVLPEYCDNIEWEFPFHVAIAYRHSCHYSFVDRIAKDQSSRSREKNLSLIHISEPTRLLSISYAVFCL